MAHTIAFYLAGGFIVVSALVVALSRNIIYSVFALLTAFIGVAGVYALLSADFLAVAQLLLYVGGILVLILFAVMLTDRIADTKGTNTSVSMWSGLLMFAAVFCGLAGAAARAPWKSPEPAQQPFLPTTAGIGESLLGAYLLPFEIVSIVLLVGLIGAVVVARKEQGR
ncbi:MAG: hypothetical protein A2583_06240 [Bdellovibrionales bacterium RIFOXYD1_FULL_53_11]|nr:MAG: hypothetical protein A2583_06240 [Bdellovibrionales bacterium RIFOXYD1_FULL_53_11]